MTVKNYHLQTASGRHIRIATKVILDNGREISFMERMSKKEAIKQAQKRLDIENRVTCEICDRPFIFDGTYRLGALVCEPCELKNKEYLSEREKL